MIRRLKKFVFSAFAAAAVMPIVGYADDPGGSINFEVIGMQDDQNYQGIPVCNLEFSLSNQSTGSIYYVSVEIDVWDDRGDQMEPQLGAIYFSTDEYFSGSDFVIPRGETVNILQEWGPKGRCKYVAEVAIVGVDPKYCNVRNLPEEANCFEMVRLTSSIESVKIRPR